MKRVYLAGPILGSSYDDVNHWRTQAIEQLKAFGIEGMSPMRGKHHLAGFQHLPESAEDNPISTRKGIVTRDRNDVMTSDAVLMYLVGAERVSIGTMVELGWADAFRKPVIMVMEEGNIHWHAFTREMAGYIVPDLDQAIRLTAYVLGSVE